VAIAEDIAAPDVQVIAAAVVMPTAVDPAKTSAKPAPAAGLAERDVPGDAEIPPARGRAAAHVMRTVEVAANMIAAAVAPGGVEPLPAPRLAALAAQLIVLLLADASVAVVPMIVQVRVLMISVLIVVIIIAVVIAAVDVAVRVTQAVVRLIAIILVIAVDVKQVV
jgi:hypothetical protein